MARLSEVLNRSLSESRTDRRVLGAILILSIGVALFVTRDDISSGLTSVGFHFRESVAPLTWGRQQFTEEAWAQTPVAERYVFASELKRRLPRMNRAQVAKLLGQEVIGDSALVELRPEGHTNLWYVLHVEFTQGVVTKASVRLAWLDP